MIVCMICKKEMRCLKTGLGARFGNSHVYPGDAYYCSTCNSKVIVTNDSPMFDPDNKVDTIQMKED